MMNPKSLLLAVVVASVFAMPTASLAVGPPAGVGATSNPGTSHIPSGTPSASNNPGSANVPAGTPTPSNHPDGSNHPSGSDNPGSSNAPATPGPNASLPAKAKAYGKYCQNESKTHVAGQHGTLFSKCVTDMAKAANDPASNPTSNCQGESKKHVAGQHGTAFSKCVSDAAKLHSDEQAAGGTTGTSTTGSTSTPTS
jgi:hypothetical protein